MGVSAKGERKIACKAHAISGWRKYSQTSKSQRMQKQTVLMTQKEYHPCSQRAKVYNIVHDQEHFLENILPSFHRKVQKYCVITISPIYLIVTDIDYML